MCTRSGLVAYVVTWRTFQSYVHRCPRQPGDEWRNVSDGTWGLWHAGRLREYEQVSGIELRSDQSDILGILFSFRLTRVAAMPVTIASAEAQHKRFNRESCHGAMGNKLPANTGDLDPPGQERTIG